MGYEEHEEELMNKGRSLYYVQKSTRYNVAFDRVYAARQIAYNEIDAV